MRTEEDSALRREVEELRRQLEEQRKPWRPSSFVIWGIILVAIAVIVVAFFAGYIPLKTRDTLIRTEAASDANALPRVDVIQVGRASGASELDLPGNIEAITEAPILARADGYLARRMVDIGDRVQAGQPVAEIAAPELDEQVRQLKAAL